MRVTLSVVAGPHKGQVFSFVGHDTFLVGRSKRSHFRLPAKDKFFSRVHFLVEVNPPLCRIMDMKSRNGTKVNGQPVEMKDLNNGDLIQAGKTVFHVTIDPTAVEAVAAASPPPAAPAQPSAPSAGIRESQAFPATAPPPPERPAPPATPSMPPFAAPPAPTAPAKEGSFSFAVVVPRTPPTQATLSAPEGGNVVPEADFGAAIVPPPLPMTTPVMRLHTTREEEEPPLVEAIPLPPELDLLPDEPPPLPLPAEPEFVRVVPPQRADIPPAAPASLVCRVCDARLPEVSSGPAATDMPSLLCRSCLQLISNQVQFIEGYHIIRPIGQGSMGVVYLAVRKGEDALVALKTIMPAVAGTPTQVERFLREARILQKLIHPHIVSFRDMGESGGKIYFAMDYVRGQDASKLLKAEGPLKQGRAATLVCQLLEALDFAHQQGFVHRDIKPSNMMVTEQNGREIIKLADFGLARVYQSSQLSGLTMSGDIGGTVAFMAPEQITHYREARPPVDQYAAAASLYNLLTGQYVYDLPREFPRQLGKILNEDTVPIRERRSDISSDLAAVVHRALNREPADRYRDAREFHTALSRFAR